MNLSDAAAPPTIKLYLLYRNRLFKEVMELRFRGDRRLALVGATTSANEAIRQANGGSRVDVVLIEKAVERGLAVWFTRSLHRVQARTKVMPVGLRRTSEIVEFLRAGAAGYLNDETIYSELVATFESLERGEPPCSFTVAGRVCSAISSLSRKLPERPFRPTADGMTLTPREKEVARFIARGLSNKDIARELGISPATIKNHVHNVLHKLRAQGRDEIVLRAYQGAISATA